MTKKSQKNFEDQEIDLSVISDKIGGLFQNINTLIFEIIQFFFRKKIIIGGLILLGVGLGLYMDRTQKSYKTQVIVTPNFGSSEYLYSQIDLIQSKIQENDLAYLKSIGIQSPEKLKKIEIKPIIDVYKFVNNNDKNFELLKLMAEDGDIKKILEENTTSKNYMYHLITFFTNSRISNSSTTQPILNSLNDNSYFKAIQESVLQSIKIKMANNEITMSQIDGILNQSSSSPSGDQKSEKLVFYNGNTQLNDVLKTKDDLIKEQGVHRIELIDYGKSIKEISITSNIINTELLNGKRKIILPILFVFLYILVYLFSEFYTKQVAKLSAK